MDPLLKQIQSSWSSDVKRKLENLEGIQQRFLKSNNAHETAFNNVMSRIRPEYPGLCDDLNFDLCKKTIRQMLKSVIDQCDFCSRTPVEAMFEILRSGRFHTCLEGPRSMGGDSKDYRVKVLQKQFGLHADLKNDQVFESNGKLMSHTMFEVYGYAAQYGVNKGTHNIGSYGPIEFIFKKSELMNRTTMYMGDSINVVEQVCLTAYPCVSALPRNGCEGFIELALRTLLNWKKNKKLSVKISLEQLLQPFHVMFLELQFHGGVTTQDVQAIKFNGFDIVKNREFIDMLPINANQKQELSKLLDSNNLK